MSDKPSSSSTNWDPLLKHSSALGILKPGIVFSSNSTSSSSGRYGGSSSSSSTSGYGNSGYTGGNSSYTYSSSKGGSK